MEKGKILKDQRFERYFMAEIEIVDAKVLDFVGEYSLIVKIGVEKHKVNFSLCGTMRSKGIVEG